MSIKYLFFFSCFFFSCAQADGESSMGNAFNRALGSSYRFLYKMAAGKADLSVQPQDEKLVRDIAQQMNIQQDIQVSLSPEAFKAVGPHNVGNCIFFNKEWFDQWRDYKDVQKFIIGHELSHLKDYHTPIRTFTWVGGALASYYLLNKASQFSSLSDTIDTYVARKVSWFPQKGRTILGKLMLFSMASRIALLLTKKVSRVQEYQADAEALRMLSPIYGDAVTQGAATYLSRVTSFKKYGMFEKIFQTHPHSRDRLRKLGLSKEVSQNAASELERIFKERVLIRLEALHGPQYDHGRILGVIAKMQANWLDISRVAALCSVDPHVAEECIDTFTAEMHMEYFHEVLGALSQEGDSTDIPSEWLSAMENESSEILDDPQRKEEMLLQLEQSIRTEAAVLKDILCE